MKDDDAMRQLNSARRLSYGEQLARTARKTPEARALKFGDEEQKQRWIVPGLKGEKVGALAITEPAAGSDVAGLRTFARRQNGEYVSEPPPPNTTDP